MSFFTVNYKTTTTFSVSVEADNVADALAISDAVVKGPIDNETVERAKYQSSDQLVELINVESGTLYPSRAIRAADIEPEYEMPLSYARHVEGN